MNSKHKKTLELLFRNPINAGIPWDDIKSLFATLGAELSEGTGSRLRVKLNGVRAVSPIRKEPRTRVRLFRCENFLKMRGCAMMEYRGYLGTVEYDAEAKIFHGDVINTRDVITFQGTTVDGIERAFENSVDDYLAWCESEGVEPEKPYSGKFNVRLSPQLHRQVAILAKKRRMSLNSFVEKALADEVALLQRAH